MSRTSKDGFHVGFDLGGTKMLALVVDPRFRIVARRRRKTNAHEGLRAGLERIVGTIAEAIGEANIKKDELACIGIGAPGPLDLSRGVILDAPNLGWKQAPLKKTLERAFGCPAVVANDVDAGVFGEYRLGAGRGVRCLVGVFPGTGIGGGCVYDGKLVTGRIHSCLEIGHIRVVPQGPLCGCGRKGCLEAVASRLAIAAAAAAAAARGEAPHLMKLAGTDLSDIRSGMLAQSIRAGDAAVEAIVRHAARWLGIGVATVVNLLAPDVVVLGGGLVEALPEFYREEVEKSARRHVLPAFERAFDVVAAKLGDDATALGAAAWAERSIRGSAPAGE